MKIKSLMWIILAAILEGAGVIFLLLETPSEHGWLLGYSMARWSVLAAAGLVELLLAWFFYTLAAGKPKIASLILQLSAWLQSDSHAVWVAGVCLAGAVFFFGAWLFSYLFIPPVFRWILFWGMLICAQCAAALVIIHWAQVCKAFSCAWQNFVSPLKNASRVQKSTCAILAVIGTVYFAVMIIPNALDAWTPHIFSLNGGDENITYPYVTWMLTPGGSMETNMYHFFVYEDYHYGYPFYFFSMLAVLPSRIIAGVDFSELTQINLLLLRQLISVLPMILSAFLLTYMQTQFRSKWKSVSLFLAMLLMTGVVRYNQRFWHPDALVVLCATLTIFFLNRDKFRYRYNFLLAAFFCGLASAIKLFGFFFALSIAGYVLYGLVKKLLTFKRAAIVSAAFLLVMFGTIVLSNPFLFVEDARGRMLEIMEEKSGEVREGYNEPDPEGVYNKGLTATLPFLQKPYAVTAVLVFLLLSVTASALCGNNRLTNGVLLGWVLATGIYLVFFSAIKNYHYWLPTMVPLFSGFWGLTDAACGLIKNTKSPARWKWLVPAAEGLTWLVIVFQWVWSAIQAFPYWQQLTRIGEIIQ